MSEKINVLKGLFTGSRTADEVAPVEVIPTGLPSMDNIVLGCGGLPRGRTIEIYSKPSLGKTTLTINFIANAQKSNLTCAFFDAEGTFPGPEYTNDIGLIRGDLLMPDFSDGDNALFQIKQMIALNIVDIIVVDSVKALKPRTTVDIENDSPDSMHDNYARGKMLSVFYQDIRGGYHIWTTPQVKGEKAEAIPSDKSYFVEGKWDEYYHKLQDKRTVFIMINHQMDKQGVMFGDKTTTPGGDSQKFDASIRLRISNKKKAKKKDKYGTPLHRIVTIRADKNKLAPPFREADFMLHKSGLITELGTYNPGDFEDDDETPDSEEDTGSGGIRKLKRR